MAASENTSLDTYGHTVFPEFPNRAYRPEHVYERPSPQTLTTSERLVSSRLFHFRCSGPCRIQGNSSLEFTSILGNL